MITKITKKKNRPLLFAIVAAVFALFMFIATPNLNPLYADGAFFWLIIITAALVIPNLSAIKLIQETDQNGRPVVKINKDLKSKKWVIIALVSIWGLFIFVTLFFTPLFFSKSYREQLSMPVVKEFNSDITPMDLNQIPIVDKDLARTLADKKLGEKSSLGSQVTLGEPTMQIVAGKLIWVVPLQHSDFFKWVANNEGAAGYITISATNIKDIEYVSDYKIKIQPNSFFLDDIHRRVRFSGGFFKGITDYSFELNDEGKPFWAVTTYKNTCGFNLPEADGIILVDAQTGKSQKYNLNQIPEWVDRVQPEDFIIKQINNRGKYIHGVFNFSDKDKFAASEGTNIIYKDDQCYLFTGTTSVGVDESSTGIMLVNMVTKEPILYKVSGATEVSAQNSAQGKVQDLGYTATTPFLLNLFDEPTYFMTLKDSARLIKKYAFVSVSDYSIVGVGDSMPEAKADYAKAINQVGDKLDFKPSEDVVELSAKGTINRINFTLSGDKTIYSFTIDEKPGVIFTAELPLSSKLPLTVKGDSIQIKYKMVEDKLMQVLEFTNYTL